MNLRFAALRARYFFFVLRCPTDPLARISFPRRVTRMRLAEALCVFIFGMTAHQNPMGSTKLVEATFYHDRRISG